MVSNVDINGAGLESLRGEGSIAELFRQSRPFLYTVLCYHGQVGILSLHAPPFSLTCLSLPRIKPISIPSVIQTHRLLSISRHKDTSSKASKKKTAVISIVFLQEPTLFKLGVVMIPR